MKAPYSQREPSVPIKDSHPLDTAIEIQLAALIIFSPLAFGVVHAWSQLVIVTVSSSILGSLLIKSILHGRDRALGCGGIPVPLWLSLPVVAWVGWTLLQSLALPAEWIRWLSPATTQIKQSLALPDQTETTMSFSFYPGATRNSLCALLAVATVFLAVLDSIREERRIRRMLWTIAFTAAGIVLLTFTQDIAGNGKIYWTFTGHGFHDRSGPFVNHSNFCQYMNLSLGAVLGLLLIELNRLNGTNPSRHTGDLAFSRVISLLSSSASVKVWFLMMTAILSVTVVFLSLSRGGMISLLTAGGITCLLLVIRNDLRKHASIMAILNCLMLICIVYFGFDAVYDRLASFADRDTWQERLSMVDNSLNLVRQFSLAGTGLGTFSVVFPMADTGNNPARAAHLENEYIQMLLETGSLA